MRSLNCTFLDILYTVSVFTYIFFPINMHQPKTYAYNLQF